MSVLGTLHDSSKRFLLVLGLFSFSLHAQQAANSPTQSNGSSSAAQSLNQASAPPVPFAPEPKKLPLITPENYSKSVSYFPKPFAPYDSRPVPQAIYTNAPKIEDMIKGGKIMLSMNDAVSLGLADNLDIAIARYNLPIADTDILRTLSGAPNSGVNSGVVQNTQGGGGIAASFSGAAAGGTTAGAAGVGVGANGVVATTVGAGPNVDNFDPTLTGTLQVERSSFPQASGVLTGVPSLLQNQTIGNFTYSQGFAPGTFMQVSFQNSRVTSNSKFSTLSPLLSSSFRLQIRQHLLQGFGMDVNQRFITIARNTKVITQEGFREQIISTVSQIQNIYWDLVLAYEDLRVKERSLALAQKTLSDNKKQVEIGTLAPIEIVRAQSTVAQSEQDVLTARTTLQLEQLFMKSAITRNLGPGSPIADAEVVPTDTVAIPDQDEDLKVDDLLRKALDNRPDYVQQIIGLKNRQLSNKSVRNALLPSVDLIGFYGAAGQSGNQSPAATCLAGQTNGCIPVGSIASSGFGTAFGNLFDSSGPDKGVAVQINIPIRNRAAQALQARSVLEYRQAELSIKQFENNIAIQVRNELFTLLQLRARVVSAREALELAAQTLDAEQKKYALGASTYINVLSDQAALATAQENVLSAEINYAKQRVTLDRDTGQTLDHNNIRLDETTSGNIKTQPVVQGLRPNTFMDQNTDPTQQPPAPPKQ